MGVESVRGARRELLNGWALCDMAVFGAFHGYIGEDPFLRKQKYQAMQDSHGARA